MIELAVRIWQLFHSFDTCADKEDSYLYCFHIELSIQVFFFVFLLSLISDRHLSRLSRNQSSIF